MAHPPPIPPPLADLDDAMELLHFAFREVLRESDRLLTQRGFSRLHHRILFFARRNEGITVSELLHVLDVTKQALHGPLLQLQKQKLVTLARDPADGRVRRLVLTREGAAYERKISEASRRRYRAAFQGCGRVAAHGWVEVMRVLGRGQSSAARVAELRGRGGRA